MVPFTIQLSFYYTTYYTIVLMQEVPKIYIIYIFYLYSVCTCLQPSSKIIVNKLNTKSSLIKNITNATQKIHINPIFKNFNGTTLKQNDQRPCTQIGIFVMFLLENVYAVYLSVLNMLQANLGTNNNIFDMLKFTIT